MKRSCLSGTLILLVCILLPAQVNRPPINISHFGRITDLLYDGERQLLFSSGEDGTVRIWNTATGALESTLRLSHRPVLKIAVHPSQPYIAALIGERLSADTLVAWNWERQRRIFTIESEQQFLYLGYSPRGSYLFYSQADYNSLTAVNPRTGRVLPYMGRGFGIVSYFTVGRNEGNIMTYQPSGRLSYRDIRTSRIVKEVKTLPDLSCIRISPNNCFIAASSGSFLVIIDLLNGELVDRTRQAGILDLSFSPAGNEIAGIVETEGATELRKWYFGGNRLIELASAPEGSVPGLCSLDYGEGELYLADRRGTIFSLSAGGEREVLSEDRRLQVSGLAFRGSSMAVGSSEGITIYDSEFFNTDYIKREMGTLEVRELKYPNPFSTAVGLAYLDERRLLVWTKSEEPGRMAVLDSWYGGSREIPVSFESPIKQVTASEQGIAVVEKSGLGRILDPGSFATTFRYHAPGLNKLVFAFGDTLIGAKTSLSTFGGPLLQINRRTGETVPIQEPSLFVYDVLYSEQEGRTGSLYCLAVEEKSDGIRTLLKSHSGFTFERSRILVEFQGEDLGASLASDDVGRIYTSLGYRMVEVTGNGRIEVLEDSLEVPRSLFVHGDKIFSLNRDSSISIWGIGSHRLIFNLLFFKDGTWSAVTPEGEVRSGGGFQS